VGRILVEAFTISLQYLAARRAHEIDHSKNEARFSRRWFRTFLRGFAEP